MRLRRAGGSSGLIRLENVRHLGSHPRLRGVLDRLDVLDRLIAIAALSLAVLATSCTPVTPAISDADPVLIVGGTGAPAAYYAPLAQRLRSAGYKVYIYQIPSPLDAFDKSARTFQTWFDALIARTGRSRFDLIGHSQGVVLMRYAAKFLGSAPHIDTMITLSGGIHGAQLPTDLNKTAGCFGMPLCQQSAIGSDFVTRLNDPSDTLPGVHHVNITTIYDQIATPYANNLMTGPGDVTNVVVQDQCPADRVDHVTLPFDGPVASGIALALAHQPVTLDCHAS